MKTLIIGMGEVGEALYKVFADHYEVWTLDKDGTLGAGKARWDGGIEIIHIAFPYSENFVDQVRQYQKEFEPKYTVIHSTVPVGTSGFARAIHSPIRGIHPNLAEGIKTFVKFLGGPDSSQVADYFRRAGINVALFDRSETTEAGKLFDTEYYRACIEFCHRVKKYCDANALNFHEVYTMFNQTYNQGYYDLRHPEFIRPVLQPIMTPIGGHCVMQNKELIDDEA